MHLYVAHAEGQGNGRGDLPKSIDVRGTGGYVLAPGAWADAGHYRSNGDLGSEVGFGMLPEWPEALRPKDRAKAENSPPGDHDLATLREAANAIPADLPHDEWVAVLMALHHESGGSAGGLAVAQAWSAADPRWTAAEVRAKWRSFGKSDCARVGAGTLFRLARDHGWTAPVEFDDVPDEDDPPSSRLTLLSPAECAISEPRRYVVKGLVAEGDVGCIVGAPGVGKSLLAPGLAYAVAQGERFFGRRVRQGGVLYVAAEDAHGMRGRITALRSERGEADAFRLVEGVSDLLTEDVRDGKRRASPDFRDLRRAVRDERPALVVIDTLAMAFPGLEENSAEGMGRVMDRAKRLTEWGAAVILVHHDTKAGGGLPRGHSLLNGALDLSIALARNDDDGTVRGRLTKNRNGPCHADLAFTIRAVQLGTDEDGDPITAAIADPFVPQGGPVLTHKAAMVLDLLPADGASIADDDWRAAAVALADLSDSDKPNTRRAAYRRARDELVGAGAAMRVEDGFRLATITAADFTPVEDLHNE